MAGIGKIKIRKQSYQFGVKKRYSYEGHYRIKERPPIELIKDMARTFLAPRKAKKERVAPPPPPGGFNFVVFGAAILIAVIILALGWIYLTTQFSQPQPGIFQPQLETASLQNAITGTGVMTAGGRSAATHVAGAMVDYRTANLANYTVSITTYDGRLPSEVFVLNSGKVEAGTYPDFLRTLRANLAKRQMPLNEISIRQLETIPQGAIVVVPSGVVPQELLGINSSIGMDGLADRGVVVVYIGQPFGSMLKGTLVVDTPEEVTEKLPVAFYEDGSLTPEGGFRIFQPLYRASSRGGWSSDLAYNSVSIIRKDDGAFIFVPQTLDGGWRGNYTSAADDITRIIFEMPWVTPNAPVKTYIFTNQTGYSGKLYFFSEPFKGNRSSMKLEFVGYPAAGAQPVRQTLVTWAEKKIGGELFVEQGIKIVSTNVTNDRVRLNARLREPVAAQPRMFLNIVDSGGVEVQSFPQGSVNVQADSSFDMPVYVDRGEYIVKLVDDAGRTYAQTYMKVVSIDILFRGVMTEKRSIYLFDVTMDGNPQTLGEVSVTVDGGSYGTYEFDGVSSVRVDVGERTGGDMLPIGMHQFDFSTGGLKLSVPVERPRPSSIFDNPLLWLVVVLTGGIVGIGVIFARQEGVYYSLDIPDFPPIARTRIPLPPDTVLGVLAKVNENYRWQNTPLAASEIKNGFKDIFYKGKPIYVTDYNVEYLLNELEKKEMVRESMGYYGLVQWEKNTGHSINYLAVMRRLRDICVNNAVPFTALGESKNADSEVTVAGQQMFLHFYEKEGNQERMLGNALRTIVKGITIIVLRNEADKMQFQALLQSPAAAPLILRMEAGGGSVQLLTADEFEKMLIEFKSM